MPENDKVITVVHEWVIKAENDLKAASHILKLGEECPRDTVCFHAQQCVEKYLKAFLVLEDIDFPKTHDIEVLTALLPKRVQPKLADEEQAKLTEYATVARYPGWGPIPLAEPQRAVVTARRVRKEMRALLPKETLRRKK